MKVKLDGFRELEAALAELPKATGKNVIGRVLKRAGQPLLDDMIARAPIAAGPYYSGRGARRKLKQPGQKKNSLALSMKLNKTNRRDKLQGKSVTEVYIGSRRGSTAQLFEFGTSKMAPRPYMLPAWESTKGMVLTTIQNETGTEINKAAARLAKKRGKA